MAHVPAEHFDGMGFHLITPVEPGIHDRNVIAVEITPEKRKCLSSMCTAAFRYE